MLFNIFLEKILWNTLQDLKISVLIGGKQLSNLRLANDIDLMAGSNIELQSLTNRLAGYSKAYEMSISIQKSKVMVNIVDPEKACVRLNRERHKMLQETFPDLAVSKRTTSLDAT